MPESEPSFSILFDNLLFVFHPIVVPSVNGNTVMDSTVFDSVDFESLSLKLVRDPVEWAGGISTGENISVHEETPD